MRMSSPGMLLTLQKLKIVHNPAVKSQRLPSNFRIQFTTPPIDTLLKLFHSNCHLGKQRSFLGGETPASDLSS